MKPGLCEGNLIKVFTFLAYCFYSAHVNYDLEFARAVQVTEQPATVGVPLVLEPLSGFYFSPVLVLDFLSLYPSIVIANNICYSTCLGSVEVSLENLDTKSYILSRGT